MLKNNNGFSIVELLAIIFISSVIIWPLMTTLVGNIEINDRLQDRRSALGISESSLYGLDKMDWTVFDGLVNNANLSGDYYIELDSTSCINLGDGDKLLCDELFGCSFNNLVLDASLFKVYIYDYNLSQIAYNRLTTHELLPDEVKNEISTIEWNDNGDSDLLRVTIWIEYSDTPISVLVVSGLILK